MDGEVRELAEEIALDKNKRHDIDVVIDRLIVKEGIRKRLRDSLETAAGLSDGLVSVGPGRRGEVLFSERYACPDCGISITELAPRMFSFNSPYGACPDCGGLGTRMYFDEELSSPTRRSPSGKGRSCPGGKPLAPLLPDASTPWPSTTSSTSTPRSRSSPGRSGRSSSTAPETEKIRFDADRGGTSGSSKPDPSRGS